MTNPHQPHSDWVSFERTAPAVVSALFALGKAVDESGLDKELTELIKVRASQINGCAFCLQFHLNLARKLGTAPAKLDLLPVWPETKIYSGRERTALAWTEALSRMDSQPVSEAAFTSLKPWFSETEIVFLTSAIGAINAWNRIAGGLNFAPPIPAERLSSEIAQQPPAWPAD